MIIAGVILFIIGFTFRMIAIGNIKNFNLAIERPERIVTDGLYKFVRHPSYVGSIVCFVGMSLISMRLTIIYLVFIFFLARAIEEEKLLLDDSEYSDYMSKTGMFMPKFWRKKWVA